LFSVLTESWYLDVNLTGSISEQFVYTSSSTSSHDIPSISLKNL
jgi:hypothetical protein